MGTRADGRGHADARRQSEADDGKGAQEPYRAEHSFDHESEFSPAAA